MLIEELLPEKAIGVIGGASFTGKTFFAMELARAVAYGEPCMGRWPVRRTGNVLFLEQDAPEWDTGRAFYGMIRKQLPDLIPQANGAIPGDHCQWIFHGGFHLLRHADIVAIADIANDIRVFTGNDPDTGEPEFEEGCALIVLDTLGRFTVGIDENDNTQMTLAMQGVTNLQKLTGASIVILHHSSSAGKALRGATAIEGAADAVYHVTKKRKGAEISHVDTEKSRGIAPVSFTYRITDDGSSKAVVATQVKPRVPAPKLAGTHSGDEVLEYICRHPGSKHGQIVRHMASLGDPLGRRATEKRLVDLEKAGKITRQKDGVKVLYFPPEEPDATS